MTVTRCQWAPADKPDYVRYHDEEWGTPVHDDHKLFEMLILEGAQAGLSWYTILQRRDGYRAAFRNFDPQRVARMTDAQLQRVLETGNVIRNRLKVFSARTNARVFLAIQEEFGTFDAYVWRFVGGAPRVNRPKTMRDVPADSPESDALSKDLKKRGMSFVGSTIMYAYMQAVGLVDDHMVDCFVKTMRGTGVSRSTALPDVSARSSAAPVGSLAPATEASNDKLPSRPTL